MAPGVFLNPGATTALPEGTLAPALRVTSSDFGSHVNFKWSVAYNGLGQIRFEESTNGGQTWNAMSGAAGGWTTYTTTAALTADGPGFGYLQNGGVIWYRIAVNTGSGIVYSNTVRFPGVTLPAGPGNLDFYGTPTLDSRTLTWSDCSSNEGGFVIERATDSNFTQNVVLLTPLAPGNAEQITDDEDLTTGYTYYYRIWSFNQVGIFWYDTTFTWVPL